MGQLFSSEEDLSDVKASIDYLLYKAMLDGGAVPNLEVVHPRFLVSQDENVDSRSSLQQQLQQVNKI